MSVVTIGPNFFKKELKDYSNWRWAYIREALQNCIDARGSKNIHVRITKKGDQTEIVFSNDGEPMDKDTIVNKLLCLGESGKNFEGSVGGFGKAKVLLYFAHENYQILSGKYHVTGQSGSYEIAEVDAPHHGTKSTVLINDYCTATFASELLKFAKHAQWDGKLTMEYDGHTHALPTNQHKGTFRKEEDFGRIYTNSDVTGIVCRIHGIPMFIDSYSTQHGIIIELPGSGTHLSSNRDMLQWKFHNKLCEFSKTLNVDYRKAISIPVPDIQHFPGFKLFVSRPVDTTEVEVEEEAYTPPEQEAERETSEPVYATASKIGGSVSTKEIANAIKQVVSDSQGDNKPLPKLRAVDFYLRNETRLEVPNHYFPDQFSEYADKLSKIWANVLRTANNILIRSGEEVPCVFSVGFVFSTEAEAMFAQQAGNIIYYLNPCKIVTDKTSTRFKKRFLLTEKERIICIAVHEIVHAMGHDLHDESYARQLTDAMAVIMKNRVKFNDCFRV